MPALLIVAGGPLGPFLSVLELLSRPPEGSSATKVSFTGIERRPSEVYPDQSPRRAGGQGEAWLCVDHAIHVTLK